MNIAKIGNRPKRRKNVKLYEITVPAQTVRIEATAGHVALNYIGAFLNGISVKEVTEITLKGIDYENPHEVE